ncbi:hypothetical protein OCS_00270 [Ophiocordyceps sinensis CO18]|uniref:Toxin biosynthesis protein n=1 Tax=Ophiocordyceps sinensis (strain Co18 / CGMCC 3.14243) TaxID=911162 RepID=T5AQA9_OPHSC|nr:hypothetical protein OCS_00270 [Ophiocordyceps sinensis CO18]
MSSAIFNVVEHVIGASHMREYPCATANSQDEKLLLHVKQYVPRDNASPRRGDLTVIGAHANGFPKELYEPLWDDFYHQAKHSGVRIRAIWISDAAWQGRSGLLNQGKLGNDPSWHDYSRDMLQLITTFATWDSCDAVSTSSAVEHGQSGGGRERMAWNESSKRVTVHDDMSSRAEAGGGPVRSITLPHGGHGVDMAGEHG